MGLRRFRYSLPYRRPMAAAGKKLHGHGASSKARSPAASLSDSGYGRPPHPLRVRAGQRYWPRRAACRRPFAITGAPAGEFVVGVRADGARERVRTSTRRLLATRLDGQGLHYSFLGWQSRRYRTWAIVVELDDAWATVVLPEWHPARPVRLLARLLPAHAGLGQWLTVRANLCVVAAGQLNPSYFVCCSDPGPDRCHRPAWRPGELSLVGVLV